MTCNENKIIALPPYDWFVNKSDNKPITNTFTGSFGTDKKRGCLASTTFNYKVYIVDIGTENARLAAECYILKPWSTQKDFFSTSQADCSSKGLEEIALWLERNIKKFVELKIIQP